MFKLIRSQKIFRISSIHAPCSKLELSYHIPRARPFSSLKPPDSILKTALEPEINALRTHSSLINQTTLSSVVDLVDIRPMMSYFDTLVKHGAGNLVVKNVLDALNTTAKEMSYTLRKATVKERLNYETELTAALCTETEKVVEAIKKNDIDLNQKILNQLYSIYENIDPASGVEFYEYIEKTSTPTVTSPIPEKDYITTLSHDLAIKCLLKSGASLAKIENIYLRRQSNLGKVYLAWAYICRGETAKSLSKFNELISVSDQLTAYEYSFLLDAFIGDAPTDLAVRIFSNFKEHVPHHASMTRLLTKIVNYYPGTDNSGDANYNINDLYAEYLERLKVPSELSTKRVTNVVVSKLIETAENPEELLTNFKQLHDIYLSKFGESQVLLNMLLSEAGTKLNRDQLRPVVLAVQDYSQETPLSELSKVSLRVRLNTLQGLHDMASYIELLWTEIKSRENLQRLDWLAFYKATSGNDYFTDEWNALGKPFLRGNRRTAQAVFGKIRR